MLFNYLKIVQSVTSENVIRKKPPQTILRMRDEAHGKETAKCVYIMPWAWPQHTSHSTHINLVVYLAFVICEMRSHSSFCESAYCSSTSRF